eukprot:TRINITY_DN12230_c0_g1_i1.p1 TRINITY_DN12230_c0_g1~~TRINITY_DN12230_c0_g1_i1.p1  ORF type:complete len:747 (-),score=137.40 TRINITY_DN12230_c0_g1_i1:84-2288(-)
MSLDQLIPVINKLQEVLSTVGIDAIDLPQIVVVGSQSSGKSSVLENIVGRDFLPRGSGIVTRRPLVLQLIKIPAQTDKSREEWGEFVHKASQPIYDFNQIRDEIALETDRETGRNKGISNKPIMLKIYSPHVLNLTLVDLPGITRVPIGDQPLDIEIQIRNMILQYISKPNALILAVSAANSDLSNSDAIQIAREVDPEGARTIGVLTKVDIMDRGTDALDMIMGRVVPLKLGFIPVINRSQQDINTKKPIRQAVKEEQEFFQRHPKYRSIAAQCGTLYLSKTLNQILLYHIRDTLPDLKAKVNKMMQDAHSELISYGENTIDSGNSKGALLLQILTKFQTDYRDSIEGKSAEVSLNELHGGARINYIFNEIYTNHLNTIQPTDGLTNNDIRTAIRNATGPRAALFIPEMSFELLVKKQIQRLLEPSLQCVDLAYDELQRIVTHLESKELQRFAVLRDRLVEVIHELLNRLRKPTKNMINSLINIELSYINTNHPDFVGAINTIFAKMSSTQDPNQPPPPSSAPPTNAAPLPGQGNVGPYVGGQAGAGVGGNPQNGAPGRPANNNGGQPPFYQNQNQKSVIQPKNTNPTTYAAPPPVVPAKPKNVPIVSNPAPGPRRADRLEQVPATIKTGQTITEKEKFETELILSLMITYFGIVRKNVQDAVPKAIMHFLVNASRENMQNELVSKLYKDELLDELLSESPEIASKRKACNTLLDALRRVNNILNEIRDYNIK